MASSIVANMRFSPRLFGWFAVSLFSMTSCRHPIRINYIIHSLKYRSLK